MNVLKFTTAPPPSNLSRPAGTGHSVQKGRGFKTTLLFIPHHPKEGTGTFARVRVAEGPDADVTFVRRAERPMNL